MGTKTITELPSASALQGNEIFETVQVSGGFPTSVKTQARDITASPRRYTEYQDADDPQYPEQPWQEGVMQWDRDNHTLEIMNEISDMRVQVGQETLVRVKNVTGETITNGSVCYFNGVSSVDNVPTIGLAKSDVSETTISPSVATHDIPNNTIGYVTKRGIVRDIDTSHVFAGGPLFSSPVSAGEFTNKRPASPLRTVIVGLVIISDAVSGSIWAEPATLADGMKIVGYTLPLSGVTDTQIPLTGIFETQATSATGDVATDWDVGNNHAFIKVNELTTGGDIVITGDSVSEETGLVVLGDTETITAYPSGSRPAVSKSEYYQTEKKWWVVTDINVSTGTIVGINYNYGKVGYADMGNRNFRILGYRLEAYSDGIAPDMRFILIKVDGSHSRKIMHLHTIDDIGVDSDSGGDQIIDHIRTGADDRSYNSPLTNIWENGTMIVFKQLDLNDYFINNPTEGEHENQANEIRSRDNPSGYLIRIEGEPSGGGITNVQYIVLKIYYELI